jgi:hypothetical protein
MPEQMHATIITTDAPPGTQPLSWDEVRRRFDAEKWYWLATAGRDGRPHTRPVLAVCLADKVYPPAPGPPRPSGQRAARAFRTCRKERNARAHVSALTRILRCVPR